MISTLKIPALKTSVLVSRALTGYQTITYFSEDWLEAAGLLPYVESVWRSLDTVLLSRPNEVNRELLDSFRPHTQPEQPLPLS